MQDSFYQEADSLDAVIIKYQAKFFRRFKFMALGLVFATVVCTIGIMFICALLGVWSDFLGVLLHPSRSWMEFIGSTFIYWLSFGVVLLFSLSIISGYNLVFDKNGIRGTYNNGFISDGNFINAITVKTDVARYTIYDLNRVDGVSYIAWDNFKSFSRYKDYIVLWRSENPQATFGIKFFLYFDSWIFLGPGECPLKVCGTRSDLVNLQDYLSGRLPQIQPPLA